MRSSKAVVPSGSDRLISDLNTPRHIGRDTGTQVSKLYDGEFVFRGGLDRVLITLTD